MGLQSVLKSRKGQVFIITAVIFIVVLLMLRLSINVDNIKEKEIELESNLQRKYFDSIKDELVKIVEISYYTPENITYNVFSFSNFSREFFDTHLFDFKLFYLDVVSPKNGNQLNVTVINLLNNTINVSVSINTTPIQSVSWNDIEDYGKRDTYFTIVQGENYVLNVNYSGNLENVTVPTKNGKSVYTGFFDVRLETSKIRYKDKFQKTYTLPI